MLLHLSGRHLLLRGLRFKFGALVMMVQGLQRGETRDTNSI